MDSQLADHSAKPWDAVIVGSGPAGAAAAISLARQDRRVLMLEKQSTVDFKLGESLPPAALGIVSELLGPIESLDMFATGMRKTNGNVSCWESDIAQTSDFFFTPAGYGLCVDRACFDQALRIQALAEGVQISTKAQFLDCQLDQSSTQKEWQIEVKNSAGRQSIRARYLIDASGRNSVVAKALKVPKLYQDELFAFAQRFESSRGTDTDRYTRIEAGQHGWWYSNFLPGEQDGCSERLVVFHTDKNLAQARQAATTEGFTELLSASSHLCALLKSHDYKPIGKIRGAAAGSECLARFTGERWLAVGDAAQAYDPLSSQGMFKALSTGMEAGQMVDYALHAQSAGADDKVSSQYLTRYHQGQQQRWTHYLQQLDFYYQSQQRWSDQPFWSRRSTATDSEPKLLREAS